MKRAFTLLFVVLLCSTTLYAQTLTEGVWEGFMVSPGGQIIDMKMNVEEEGQAITMDWVIGSFELTGIHLLEDRFKFYWQPDFALECIMKELESGAYVGSCKDPWEGLGPMMAAPPGVKVTPDDLDIDEAYGVWDEGKQPTPEEVEMQEIDPEGRLVTVDGAAQNYFEMGNGQVPIVLVSDLGDDLRVWTRVQASLAEFARVVSYDRAGLGYSESNEAARTPQQIASELHDLLTAASIAPPYVLVGHGVAGFYVRSYASMYPDEVAGMVLIDPSHEALGMHMASLDAKSWDDYQDRQNRFYSIMPKTVEGEYTAYRDILDRGKLPQVSSWPDVPLMVLTSARPVEEPRWVGETEEGRQLWINLHHRWVEELPQAEQIVTRTSGSYIQREDPMLLVEAVKKVMETVQ